MYGHDGVAQAKDLLTGLLMDAQELHERYRQSALISIEQNESYLRTKQEANNAAFENSHQVGHGGRT
jgi:hypothetical protein